MPKRLQSRILKMIGYPYINMEVTIKNALSMLEEAGFKLKRNSEGLPFRHNETFTASSSLHFYG
jgi:hypothetical protein